MKRSASELERYLQVLRKEDFESFQCNLEFADFALWFTTCGSRSWSENQLRGIRLAIWAAQTVEDGVGYDETLDVFDDWCSEPHGSCRDP